MTPEPLSPEQRAEEWMGVEHYDRACDCTDCRDVASLTAAIEEAVAAEREAWGKKLRSIEFSDHYCEENPACPVCGRDKSHGHADDCWLAAAIRREP